MDYEKILVTPYFEIERSTHFATKGDEPYSRLVGSDSVICCSLTLAGEIVFVRQFRPNICERTLNCPQEHRAK